MTNAVKESPSSSRAPARTAPDPILRQCEDPKCPIWSPDPHEAHAPIAPSAARTATTDPGAKSAVDAFLFLADCGYGVRLSADQTRALAAEIRAALAPSPGTGGGEEGA